MTPPSTMAPICPAAVGTASTSAAAATASVARSRSGASVRIMPSTALATTATATTFSPCSQPLLDRAAERIDAVAEGDQRQRRWQSKSEPGRQRAEHAAANETDADADLAAGRSRQKLTERHQIGVALLVEPMAAHDIFIVEVAEMRDRSAERGEPEAQRDGEHFDRPRTRRCR